MMTEEGGTLSRRGFLVSSGVAAAAAWLGPRRPFAQESTRQPPLAGLVPTAPAASRAPGAGPGSRVTRGPSASFSTGPRIYAAGDVADTAFKQAITGVAEGVTAAYSAYQDLVKSHSTVAEASAHQEARGDCCPRDRPSSQRTTAASTSTRGKSTAVWATRLK